MIGVLALQGNYSKHIEILDKLKICSCEVRYNNQLDEINGLIIPGGESTTMTDLMSRNNFYDKIQLFSQTKPILGTCAGLIMMAKSVLDKRVKPLEILDIEVDRNAYGRQVHSFVNKLPIKLEKDLETISVPFIRAPQITKVGKNVEIISNYNKKPVAVKSGIHMGLSFHPELNNITIFHDFVFIKQFSSKTYAA
ncbi:MAG: pyridoxal 5'-phosphate synthase glutaminase subunit PdxT [Candidatus Neomarinimicrobiota bacterium]|nr:pyridoxal 5'-phosphate synthase glutaminase subunit PdxT [Candidatus Neomarinimicrobiota bacterium]